MDMDETRTAVAAETRRIRFGTWNMDYWKRTVAAREHAWALLDGGLGLDVALLQECVAPGDLRRDQVLYREIGGGRPWGSAVATFGEGMRVEEIGAVRTRYASTRFTMIGTFPGAVMVGRVHVPGVGAITCVSVYGLINVYSQTSMLRIVADLIPLFDSPDGERVVLGGDFNVSSASRPDAPELRRYEAVLSAVESLGLMNLVETAAERPAQFEHCLCGAAACHHLRTYGNSPGTQLDWLFATPELARRCVRISADDSFITDLSDHTPIVAELDVPLGLPYRQWDPETFAAELGKRQGADVGRVAEEIVAWALRKHERLRRQGHANVSLDRLPTSTGPDPELWIQVDLRRPNTLAYTVSLRSDGRVVVQFQHMRLQPFDTEQGRAVLWDRLASIDGVDVDRKLTGRPTFEMRLLHSPDRLTAFLDWLEYAVDRVVEAHEAIPGDVAP
ncbi:hypothetical protein BH23GEM9_BH23GEM9_20000 [soil metagenome]